MNNTKNFTKNVMLNLFQHPITAIKHGGCCSLTVDKSRNKFGMTLFGKILSSLIIVFMASIPAIAAKTAATGAGTPTGKELVSKFGMAMLGVMLFSFVIYIGLSIYNKFFVDSQIKDFKLRKDSLRTPSDKDEAIMMYIAKNRLR